jgi:hypothetical protein
LSFDEKAKLKVIKAVKDLIPGINVVEVCNYGSSVDLLGLTIP